jgi:hypothetical protein
MIKVMITIIPPIKTISYGTGLFGNKAFKPKAIRLYSTILNNKFAVFSLLL